MRIKIVIICFLFLVACEPSSNQDDIINSNRDKSETTIITNGTILTLNSGKDIIENGTLVIKGTDIIDIGSQELLKEYPSAKVIDANNGIIMPGMINLHNHLSMVAFRGIAETDVDNFEDRLFNYFFPLESNLLDRELIHVSARHAAIEMAMAGVTLTADMYYHEDEVAKAVKEVGLRGVLGETVIGFPVVDSPSPYGGLEYAEKFIKTWKDDPLIIPAIAPHAPYTVSPEILKASKALSDKYDVPILLHMAENATESEQTSKFSKGANEGKTIVEYLDGLDFLSPRLLAAHTNYVSESDIDLLKKKDVGIAHNPKANVKDMSGISPAWSMYTEGLRIGLGTDGPMSSNQLDVLNVMPYAARVARIDSFDISKYDPFDLVYMATMGGARAIHMENKIGSLEIGKYADIVILETDSPNMNPNYDPYATIAFSAYPDNVIFTMVNGQTVFSEGHVVNIDMNAHQKDWRRITAKVSSFIQDLEKAKLQ